MFNRGGRRKKGEEDGLIMDDDDFFPKPDAHLSVEHDYYYSISRDGLRKDIQKETTVKRRRLEPSDLQDEFATLIPLRDGAIVFSTDEEAITHNSDGLDGADPDDEEEKDDVYMNWEQPMHQFLDERERFLYELLYHDGFGESSICSGEDCEVGLSATESIGAIRCRTCDEVYCSLCIVNEHVKSPLHVVEEWTGNCWKKTSLKQLGLIYQLGHKGRRCISPDPTLRLITVIDVSGVHDVSYRRCGCLHGASTVNVVQQLLRNSWYPATMYDPKTAMTFGALDLFRQLNVSANVNNRDFGNTLIRITDPTGLIKVKDRNKACMRMTLQWAWLHRAKRAGCVYKDGGLLETKRGECAVRCWACPQPGVNLPDNWDQVSPEWSYLYMMILCMDANFRLKNRFRAKEKDDVNFGPGWAYFVETDFYKDFLKDYVSETDISTCTSFAALLQRDTRLSTGLRASGVGAVACARHELIRPCGVGDLQKGERYANMDYVFFSAVVDLMIQELLVSYDIACQWGKKLWDRMNRLPGWLHLDRSKCTVDTALPVWHAAGHEMSCQAANTLSRRVGAGKTDGEGIERVWGITNPAAFSTKEMGEENRHQSLDDRIDYQNMSKNFSQVTTLTRRLVVALEELDKQSRNFEEIDSSVDDASRSKWQEMIDRWLQNREGCTNPYLLEAEDTPSQKEVQAELSQLETAEAREGRRIDHGTSASAFLSASLSLEATQRALARELERNPPHSPDQKRKIDERRLTMLRKIQALRDLQLIYTPGAIRMMVEEENGRSSDQPAPNAEMIKLWLPSQLSDEERRKGCTPGLINMETKLRRSQCSDSLREIRSRLHAHHHLIMKRNANVTGQYDATRSAGIISSMEDRIWLGKAKYDAARFALIGLLGDEAKKEFRELTKDDVLIQKNTEADAEGGRRLNGMGLNERRAPRISSMRTLTSWIWTGGGIPSENDGTHMNAAVRVEWSKSQRRLIGWREEVFRLREEMRCCLRALRYHESSWRKRSEDDWQIPAAYRDGARAYAAKQQLLYQRLRESWQKTWSQPRIVHGKRSLLQHQIDLTDGILEGNQKGGSRNG